jgi:hypothetical protein
MLTDDLEFIIGGYRYFTEHGAVNKFTDGTAESGCMAGTDIYSDEWHESPCSSSLQLKSREDTGSTHR